MNEYNKKLERTAAKRRAMYLTVYEREQISVSEIARRYGVSRQRMAWMLAKAEKEKK